MSNVIDFLQRMGEDADLRRAGQTEIQRAMDESGVDGFARSVVLSGERHRLEALLGANGTVCCMVHAPDGDDTESGPTGTSALN